MPHFDHFPRPGESDPYGTWTAQLQKKIKKCHILTIFPVLGNLTHMCNFVNTKRCLSGIHIYDDNKTVGAMHHWCGESLLRYIFGAYLLHCMFGAYFLHCMFGVMHLWCIVILVRCIYGASLVNYIFCRMHVWCCASLVHCIFSALYLWWDASFVW